MISSRLERGITLIEGIIAVVIVSFLGAVIYMTFFQGNRIWRYALAGSAESDADYFLEKLTVDLRNAFPYRSNMLVGAPASLQFYTRMPDGQKPVTPDTPLIQQPIRVRYHFDQDLRKVIRTQESYQKIIFPATSTENKVMPVTDDIRNMEIQYCVPQDKPGPAQWSSYWNQSCLPKAIKLNMEYGNKNKKADKTMTRIIPIPAGGCTG